MGAHLVYRGDSRVIDGMAVLAGRHYLVELVEEDPLSLSIEVEDGSILAEYHARAYPPLYATGRRPFRRHEYEHFIQSIGRLNPL